MAKSIWSLDFWNATGERALATFAQTLVGLIGMDAVAPIWGLDWPHLIGAAGLAALLSVLKSVGAGAVTGTPSVGHLEDPAKHGGDKVKPQGPEQGERL